jgi:hypothetical protein
MELIVFPVKTIKQYFPVEIIKVPSGINRKILHEYSEHFVQCGNVYFPNGKYL